MVKRIFSSILAAGLLLLLLVGCSAQDNQNTEAITSSGQLRTEDFIGKRIAFATGESFDEMFTKNVGSFTPIHCIYEHEAIEMLKIGRADAFMLDEPMARKRVLVNPELTIVYPPFAEHDFGAVFNREKESLRLHFNEFLNHIKENGVHTDMTERWLETTVSPPMPDIPLDDANGILVFASYGELEPFGYIVNGELVGFDIELAKRFAEYMGMGLEVKLMAWESLIPYVNSGKADFAASLFIIDNERSESVSFSDPYCTGGAVLVTMKPETTQVLRTEDWVGKSIGVITGTVHDQVIEKYFPGAIPIYFNDIQSILMSLENGRIDGMLSDESDFKIFGPKYPGLRLLEPYFDEGSAGMLVSKEKPDLLEKINAFLSQIIADGTHEEMFARWIGGDETMPDIPEGTGEVLRMGTSGIADGFAFYKDGEIVGIDIEFAKRFAAHENMRLEITVFDFSGLIPAIQSGKIDYAASCFAITEERAELANYTDPYYTSARAIAVYDTTADTIRVSFWQNLKTAFERNLIREDRWKMIVDGLQVSMIITLFAFALATLLGFGVCGLRMSKNPLLKAAGKIYVTVLRGTPIVVLLMIAFYVIFAKSNISGVTVAVIAFGVNGAAFIGEIIRSAILTVDKGQAEAARSMGFSKIGAFLTVTFPQAARVAFPVYMSEFISLFKMTSVVGYIAVVDLTKAGDIIRSRTYDAFFPLLFVALVYLAAASFMIWLFGTVERMTNKRLRRKAK